MSVVDEIEIELTANAKKANTSIDNLVNKLDVLSGSLSKIDGSRLSGLANGVSRLGMATKTLSGVKATDYNRIAKGFERLANIDTSKFSMLSSGLNLLSKGMNAVGSVQNLGNITTSINAIKNLARVDMSGFDSSKLQSIASTMSSFATQMSSVGKIEGSVTRLVSAMARLSSSGQYIGNVATYFPQLGNQVVTLVAKLSSAGAIDSNIAKIVDGIARLASAGKKVQYTVANLGKLGDGVIKLLNRLKNAPQINANIANTIQGLGNLASSGSRISTVTGNASNSIKRFGNALRGLKDRIQGARKSSKGFVSSIGMFYAKFFLAIRAVKKLGEALGSAQDYIEEFNYFSVALDKIGKDSAKQFKKAGYNSAEEYAKSFRSRFSKLQTQLTGYKVDYDTGDATSQMTHNLGLDLTEVMNFNAAIAQITNSAGMLGETSIMTSKALTMLSADWSSLSNQDLPDVMNNMQSALIGQSRAVYKYGIDITSAGLAQTALSHGIRVSIKDLDQQSKMQLRALTMLEQSKVAYGDLARTINQPANQLRMLRAGFQNLARTIGSLFMPIVQKLYPYLNAMVMVLQEFAQWVANLAGIKLGDISGSVKTPETPDYSDAVDDSGKVADNMDKTAKKAKKASDNLQTFDQVNKLQGNDSDTDTGAGNGKPNNTSLDLSKQLADALGNYEKIWDKAFKSNQNKAVKLANKIKKALIDGWKKGDFSDVGKAFANKLNNSLAKIPWAKIKATTKKIAKSIATFLNGFIKNTNWKLVGKTFAEGLNTVVDTLYTFFTTFDWLTLGTSIADYVNSAVKNADFKKAGKLLGAKLRGTIQFAFGLITNINYKQLGKKIGDSINGFLEDMGKVDARTGLTGWQELGKTISDGIIGILDTIDTALSAVNWWEVGKEIGDFLGQIDWIGIFGRLSNLIVRSLFTAIKVALSSFKSDPLGVASALASVVAGFMAYRKFKAVWVAMKIMFGNGIKDSLVKSATTIKAEKIASEWNGMFGKLGAKLGTAFGKAVSAFALLEIGGQIMGAIGNKLAKDNADEIKKQISSGDVSFGNALALSSGWVSGLLKGEFKTPEQYADDFAKKVADEEKAKRKEKHQKKVSKESVKLGLSESDYAEYQRQLKKFTDTAIEKGLGTKKTKEYIASFEKMIKSGVTNVAGITKEMNNTLNKEISGKSVQSLKNLMEFHLGKTSMSDKKQIELVNKLSNAYKNGKISYADYEKIARKTYGTIGEVRKEFKKYGIELPKQTSKTKAFKDQTKILKDKMDKLGISTVEQADYIDTFETAMDNGTITMKEYKKITDSSKLSASGLADEINKLKPKSVKVEAKTDGKEDVDNLQTSVNNTKGKTVTVKAKTYGINSIGDLSVAMKTLKNKYISVNINPKLRKDWYTLVKSQIQAKKFSLNLSASINNVSAGKLKSSVKSMDGRKVNYDKLATAINSSKNIVTIGQQGQLFVKSSEKDLIKYLKKYGIQYETYAQGGFPEDGWFRASKGEYFGQFDDGTSYIANNRQIENGIASQIAPAVHAAVKAGIREVLSEMPIGGAGDVYLDGVKVTREVMSTANKISKSTGATWRMA